ncbi:hypothetical protein FRC07_008806 [Ceratobasidium sp. 392]|nr:hypothetical protein FRC07_008806 [Ceratobasidium sp. 392]
MWFLTPMLFELMGAGFTKSEANAHYELRFPRITKIHSPTDRPWTCGLGSRSLQRLANMALGLEETGNTCAEDVVDRIWGDEGNNGASEEEKKQERVEKWVKALGGKQVRQGNVLMGQGCTKLSIAKSVEDIPGNAAGEQGCPSDWEGVTGDELEISDTESRDFEGGTKRTRTQGEDGEQGDQQDLRAIETVWKRPRLATPGLCSISRTKEPISCLDSNGSGPESGLNSIASLEGIPDNPVTPTHTEPSTPRSSPPQLIQPLFSGATQKESHGIARSCASASNLDPHLLLADAFIYVAHRSAPHPASLVPASHRVFSQEALLAGIDWTGVRRRRRALEAHIPTNQTNKTAGIRRGIAIVDYERDDSRLIIDWAQSLGELVHPPYLSRHLDKTTLCIVAPKVKAKYSYDSGHSTDGLEIDVLCVVTPYSG